MVPSRDCFGLQHHLFDCVGLHAFVGQREPALLRLPACRERRAARRARQVDVLVSTRAAAQDPAVRDRRRSRGGIDLARGVVENQPHRLLRGVPVREVAAAFEPLQARIGKEGQCPLGLIRKTHPVVASPADDERCFDAAAGAPFCSSP